MVKRILKSVVFIGIFSLCGGMTLTAATPPKPMSCADALIALSAHTPHNPPAALQILIKLWNQQSLPEKPSRDQVKQIYLIAQRWVDKPSPLDFDDLHLLIDAWDHMESIPELRAVFTTQEGFNLVTDAIERLKESYAARVFDPTSRDDRDRLFYGLVGSPLFWRANADHWIALFTQLPAETAIPLVKHFLTYYDTAEQVAEKKTGLRAIIGYVLREADKRAADRRLEFRAIAESGIVNLASRSEDQNLETEFWKEFAKEEASDQEAESSLTLQDAQALVDHISQSRIADLIDETHYRDYSKSSQYVLKYLLNSNQQQLETAGIEQVEFWIHFLKTLAAFQDRPGISVSFRDAAKEAGVLMGIYNRTMALSDRDRAAERASLETAASDMIMDSYFGHYGDLLDRLRALRLRPHQLEALSDRREQNFLNIIKTMNPHLENWIRMEFSNRVLNWNEKLNLQIAHGQVRIPDAVAALRRHRQLSGSLAIDNARALAFSFYQLAEIDRELTEVDSQLQTYGLEQFFELSKQIAPDAAERALNEWLKLGANAPPQKRRAILDQLAKKIIAP